MAQHTIQILIEAKDKNIKAVIGGATADVRSFEEAGVSAAGALHDAFSGAGLTMAFGSAVPEIKRAISAYNDLRASMVGLESVVSFSGANWEDATKAIQAYTADGLIPVSQASTALKNLLLRGYGLERSIELLYRLKDAAAYGRQGQLSLGQAVAGATEGLKNENSMLVDNAGITQNISKIWQEYAKARGIKTTAMTKEMKLEAEYLGIIKESAPQVGNAALLQEELAGKMAQTEAATLKLQQAIGEGLAPGLSSVLEVLTPFIDRIRELAEANPEVVRTILGGAGLVAALGAVATALIVLGPGGLVVAGIAATLIALAATMAKLRADINPTTESLIKSAEKIDANTVSLKEMRDEYVELEGKPDKSAEEHERLNTIMEKLSESVPLATAALSDEGDVLSLNLEALDGYIDAQNILKHAKVYELETRLASARRNSTTAQTALTEAVKAYHAEARSGTETLKEYRDRVGRSASMLEWMNETNKNATDLQRAALEAVREAAVRVATYGVEVTDLTTALDRLAGITKDVGDDTRDLGEDATTAATGINRLKQSAMELAREQYMLELGITDELLYLDDGLDIAGMRIDEYYAERRQAADDAQAAFAASFDGAMNRMASGMMNWKAGTMSAITEVGDLFAGTWAAIVSGDEDAIERMMAQWENFFSWLVGAIMDIMVKWLIGKVIASIFPAFAPIAGVFSPDMMGIDVSGGMYSTGATGGLLRGGQIGVDSIPLLGQDGELLTSVSLTQGLERMVAAFEGGGRSSLAAAGGGGGDIYYIDIHTLDAASLRKMIRRGDLGRELELAKKHKRTQRL